MATQHLAAIPEGSLIIITGVASYLASYAVKDLLQRGYRIRGTVRDLVQSAWLTEEVFPSFAQSGALELVQVPDLAAPDAFNKVIEGSGASAIMHFATPGVGDPDPNNVIPKAVDGILGLLRAASQEKSIRRFVYTSSIAAVFTPEAGVPIMYTTDSYNESAVQVAWAPPPYEITRTVFVYGASKVAAEKALFKFLEEEKPQFTANVLNPAVVIGPVLHKHHLKGTPSFIHSIYNGDAGLLGFLPPCLQVNIQDVAALHVAAALDPEVKNERIFAWDKPLNVNTVLEALRRLYPDRRFMEDLPNQIPCLAIMENETHILGLLKKWAGREGWIPLEQGVREGVENLP